MDVNDIRCVMFTISEISSSPESDNSIDDDDSKYLAVIEKNSNFGENTTDKMTDETIDSLAKTVIASSVDTI